MTDLNDANNLLAPPVEIVNGRYRLTDPDTGKRRLYTRATTIAKTLDDTTNLTDWKCVKTGVGTARTPSIAAKFVACDPNDKRTLRQIASEAQTAAGADEARELGTALHEIAEKVDRGALDVDDIPDPWRATIANYRHALRRAALTVEPDWCEVVLINQPYGIAGKVDRLYRDHENRLVVGDLKGLTLDTPLPTPGGWTTMGVVETGDVVYGGDGKPCRVTATSAVKFKPCYRIRFDDGTDIVADAEHRWLVNVGWYGRDTEQVLTTEELAANLKAEDGRRLMRIPLSALHAPDVDLPLDPYVLGVWLGDGKRTSGEVTKPVGHPVWAMLETDGWQLGAQQIDKRTGCGTRTVLGLSSHLRKAGVFGDKHIPDIYLRAGRDQRLRLLQGLMDTDGCWNKARRQAVFTTTDKALATAVAELATSLGFRVLHDSTERSGFGVTVTAHDVKMTPTVANPFRARADLCADMVGHSRGRKSNRRLILAVEPTATMQTKCITVDSPDHTYLCGHQMVRTHNTGGYVGWLSFAVQFAIYATATHYIDQAGVTQPMPDVRQDHALLIHLPAGEDWCKIEPLSVPVGLDAMLMALEVRRTRALDRRDRVIATTWQPPTLVTDVTPPPADVNASAVWRAWLVDRVETIKAFDVAARTLAGMWPAGVPTFKQAATHTLDQLAAIEQAVDATERRHELPFPACRPAGIPDLDDATRAAA